MWKALPGSIALRIAGGSLLALLALSVRAQQPTVAEAAAYVRTSNIGIDVRLSSPIAAGSVLAIRGLKVQPGGKLHSRDAITLGRTQNPSLYRKLVVALGMTGVQIRGGDRLEATIELDGTPIGTISVVVGDSGLALRPPTAVAAAGPTSPPAPALPPTAPPAVVEPTATPVPAPVTAPTPLALVPTTTAPAQTGLTLPSLTLPDTPTPRATAVAAATVVPTPPRADAIAAATPSTTGEPTPPTEPSAEAAAATGSAPVVSPTPEAAAAARPIAFLTRQNPLVLAGGALLLLAVVAGAAMALRRKPKPAPADAGSLGIGSSSSGIRPVAVAPPKEEVAGAPKIGGLEVVSRLARGGLCDIYVVKMEGERRRGALKVLRQEFRMSEKLADNLAREGEILWRLAESYPAEMFVDILQQGTFGDGEGQSPYLVLELVEGMDLRVWVRKNGALPPHEALAAVRQIAHGLSCLHAAGLVHGDISPENVLWTERAGPGRKGKGSYRLIDFGDARRFDLESEEEEIAGKPSFLSPEQAAGQGASPASDVYSLGMLLYFLYMGHAAFESHHPGEVLRMQRESEVAFPTDTPAGVRGLVRRLCAKVPDLRPTAADAVGLLDRLLRERGDA